MEEEERRALEKEEREERMRREAVDRALKERREAAEAYARELAGEALASFRLSWKSRRFDFLGPAGVQLGSASGHGEVAKLYPVEVDSLGAETARAELSRVFDTPGFRYRALDASSSAQAEVRGAIPEGKKKDVAPLLKEMEELERQRIEVEKKVQELSRLPDTPERRVEIVKAREEGDKVRQKQVFVCYRINVKLEAPEGLPSPVKPE